MAEGGVVAQDVVEGENDAARIPEQDVHALPEDRLADHIGPDPRPALATIGGILVQLVALAEHLAAGALDGVGGRRSCPRDVASPLGRRRPGRGRRQSSGISLARGGRLSCPATARPSAAGAVALRHRHGRRVLRRSCRRSTWLTPVGK
jgi:hypothetical protein